MSKNLLTHHFFLLVVILCSISGSLLGEKYELEEYEKCENPDFVFPWGSDYLGACLSFQCHRVRQHKSWFRFWDRKPKYIHNSINGNEQVIQCSDCKGFLKKGTLFGGMSVCTPTEFGGDFDTPKGWVSIATASLQINREIKSKSSIKLVPDNWRIDGETSKSTLDLSKCSISDGESSVALSIIVTLSSIADPSKKLPKYRRILGLSDDSINVRIKTLGQDTEGSVNNEFGNSLDDDDDDDFEDYNREGEGPQQSMDQDDGTHDYILYDMNKMASAHHGPTRNRVHKNAPNKKRRTRRQKPFTGAEKLPRKWKLSKGQTSIYSSSDVVRLDLTMDLHPNELVEAVLTCNNKYMNCSIQQFVSCFNVLCKAVTKEELIQRAALKKARQFISDSIINGRTKPIVGYGNMQFQQNFPPVYGGAIGMQVQQQPLASNIVNINGIHTSPAPQIQGVVPVGVVGKRDASANVAFLENKLKTGVPVVARGGGVGVNTGVPRMVFVNDCAQNVNVDTGAGAPKVPGLVFRPQMNNATASHNLNLPKSGPQLNVAPGQAQMNVQYQGVQNLVSVNGTAAMARPKMIVNGQQEPGKNKVIILKSSGGVPVKPSAPQGQLKATQYILNQVPAQIRVSEQPPAAPTTKYIIKGLETKIDQTPVRYKLFLNPKPTTTTYTQVVQPHITSVEQPQIINIQLKEPPVLNSIKVVPKEPETIKLNIIQPATTSTPNPVQVKLVKVDIPDQKKQTFRIIPQEESNKAKLVTEPPKTILVDGNLKISPGETSNNQKHYPAGKVLKLEKVRVSAAPEPQPKKILIEMPETAGEAIKLVKSVPSSGVIRKVRTGGGSENKVYRLVPVDYLPRDRRYVIVSGSNLLNKGCSGSKGLHSGYVSRSDGKILIRKEDVKPRDKPARAQVAQPDLNSYIYIPKKSRPLKVMELSQKPKGVLLVEDGNSDSFDEFGANDEEYSTLILKKVSKNGDKKKFVEKDGGPDSELIGAQPLKDITGTAAGEDKKMPESKHIESNESGAEVGHSSLSDSSAYETSSQHKSYNEAGSTGKSILGYSILASVFLFTIFIIMKLFLL